MKLALAILAAAALLYAADTLEVFGRAWDVPVATDWSIAQENGSQVLKLVTHRGPPPGPRRPIQFALAKTPEFRKAKLEADVMPLQRSLMLVFAYKDEAHFDYAHLSTDTGTKQPVHNGIFHVFGGERVRISSLDGPPAFPAINEWRHVELNFDGTSGKVSVKVDGQALPALQAVDLSLTGGRVGLGSFDETACFKNVKISGQ